MWALSFEMKFMWISIPGKQDSDEDSNNLKIDERKEEKETASSAGEEKFPDQTDNTKYPKAKLLLEGSL